MATRSSDRPGLAEAAREVADHVSALARLEARLALQEIRRKSRRLVASAVLLAGAGLFGLLALLIGIAAGIAAIALALPVWAALLIVAGGLLLLAGPLGLAALFLLKAGAPPIPEQALLEARLTAEALKNGRH